MTEINDSEMLKLEKVINWAKGQQASRRDIDQFTRDIRERINNVGFEAEVKVYDTEQEGVYAFDIEINGRVGGSVFDPDRQVHEVTNNLLALPGQETGFIPTKEGLDKLAQREMSKKRGNKHKH
jgi:hypothetical protein